MYEKSITCTAQNGIHTRVSHGLSQWAITFESDIFMTSRGITVDAKSILNILTLGIVSGTSVVVSANGADEKEAVDKIIEMFSNNDFDPPLYIDDCSE